MMQGPLAGPEHELTRPQADERAADLHTTVLGNDLCDFHDPAWIDGSGFPAEVGHVVGASRDGTRNPAPDAHRLVLDRLGVAAAELLFVDEQPVNAAEARAVVWFDVTRPQRNYAKVCHTFGLAADDGGSR